MPKALEPMLCAASTRPLSTLDKALSTCLEKKGTVPTTKGTIAPTVPIAVPTTNLEKGINAASKITNGIERNKLMTQLKIVNMYLFSKIPLCLVTISTTPKNKPKVKAITPDTDNM